MGKGRAGCLLAGMVLAAIVAAPLPGHAAPDQVWQAAPPSAPATSAPPAAATASAVDLRGTIDHASAASDREVGATLRAIVGSEQFANVIDWVPDREAVARFYAARDYAPLWVRDGALSARGQAVSARLRNAAAEGLDPADYPVPQLGTDANARTLAADDLMLTKSMLDYARHLAVGRIAPRRVVPQVEYGEHRPDPADILKTVTQASDVDAAFDKYDPQARGFQALKTKLAALRRGGDDDNRIPDGPAIRPGAKDARIPALRARLQLMGKPHDTRYDRALANAIRRLQHDANLRPNGIIDDRTLAAINGPDRKQEIDTVTANMERWRWLPHDLGATYVMVNIPDYSLQVVHDQSVVWQTKIVAGKPTTPTPLVSAPMQQVIVNPSWIVPQSIIQNELLPAYRGDPNIFARMGLEVKKRSDGHLTVVQPPGAGNALGRIKFVFPNRFQVYLHDTPQKRLFAYDKRAFSHGCMRVQDPTKFGEVMLSLAMDGPTPDSRQLNAMFGQHEHDFKLAKQPMVHLTYQTAFVDAAGALQVRDDLYGFDARIHAILHSSERRVADVPPVTDPKRDQATLRSNQEILSRVERREALNPLNYFERPSR